MSTEAPGKDSSIDIRIFDTPSGAVRGMINLSLTLKGKSKRIAHATLLVASEPDVVIEVPKRMNLAETLQVADALKAFVEKVNEHAE